MRLLVHPEPLFALRKGYMGAASFYDGLGGGNIVVGRARGGVYWPIELLRAGGELGCFVVV